MGDAGRRKRILDKASLIIVAIAVFLAVVGGAFGFWQMQQTHTLSVENHTLAIDNQALTKKLITSGNNHHDATALQNTTIIGQNNAIQTLLNQHSVTFAQQQTQAAQQATYDADVLSVAEQLVKDIAIVCGGACPVLVLPPTVAPVASTP